MDFHLVLNEHDIKTISVALGELPFKSVVGLIAKLDQQLLAQQITPGKDNGKSDERTDEGSGSGSN